MLAVILPGGLGLEFQEWYLLPFTVVSQIGKDFGGHIQMYVFHCYD